MKAIHRRFRGLGYLTVIVTAFEPLPASSSSCGPDWNDLLQRVHTALDCQDSYAAFAEVDQAGGDPIVVSKIYLRLVEHFHQEDHSIGEAVLIGRAGIRDALIKASECGCQDPNRARQLKVVACDITVKVASMTWIGWGEPCSQIGDGEAWCGLDVAKLGLRLAFELDVSHEELAEAHWLVGAHHLSSGDFARACTSFEAAYEQTIFCDNLALGPLMRGYVALTKILSGAGDRYEAEREFSSAIKTLERMNDSESCPMEKQLLTARSVFESVFIYYSG